MLTTEYLLNGNLIKRIGVAFFDPIAPGDPVSIDGIAYQAVLVYWNIRGLRASDPTGEHTQRTQQIHLVVAAAVGWSAQTE